MSELLADVPQDEWPTAGYASLDGKPSDRCDPEAQYCMAVLLADHVATIAEIHDELEFRFNQLDPRSPLVKPAKWRRSRRIRCLRRIVKCLCDISIARGKLPFNWFFISVPGEALDAGDLIGEISRSEDLRVEYGVTYVSESHITLINPEGACKMTHSHFGGMDFWLKIVGQVDAQFSRNGERRRWMLNFDRPPLDLNGERSRLFASLVDHFFEQRIWMSFGEGGDYKIDLLTDIFVNLCYERHSEDSCRDPDLMREIDTLVELQGAVRTLG